MSRRCETGFLHGLEVACQEMLAKWENSEVGPQGAGGVAGVNLDRSIPPCFDSTLLRMDLAVVYCPDCVDPDSPERCLPRLRPSRSHLMTVPFPLSRTAHGPEHIRG